MSAITAAGMVCVPSMAGIRHTPRGVQFARGRRQGHQRTPARSADWRRGREQAAARHASPRQHLETPFTSPTAQSLPSFSGIHRCSRGLQLPLTLPQAMLGPRIEHQLLGLLGPLVNLAGTASGGRRGVSARPWTSSRGRGATSTAPWAPSVWGASATTATTWSVRVPAAMTTAPPKECAHEDDARAAAAFQERQPRPARPARTRRTRLGGGSGGAAR